MRVAGGRFAPGHLGELTRIVPFEMVDAALAESRATQQRLRALPSRVVVYLLLAAGLFEGLGYQQVWARMCAGLSGLAVASPCASALAAARRRIGVAPLRALFDLLRGPAAGLTRTGVHWHGLLVCAVDATMMCCPDTAANRTVYRRGGGNHGGTGYPMIRLLALVACGTRTIITATFGTDRVGETGYIHDLLGAMHVGMIVLADRNYGYAPTVAAVAGTGADLLFRIKAGRKLPICRRLPDGSWISRMGQIEVRVIRAEITITTSAGTRSAGTRSAGTRSAGTRSAGSRSAGTRTEVYQLVTTILDPCCPAAELIQLYHQRWEIETAFFELKSTILDGRVLRARTPAGVAQEVYALLVTYQALRIAISDATLSQPDLDPDRGSFTVALNTARDQLTAAAGIIADTVIADTVIDLVGEIGRQVRNHLMPARRPRTNPRVVKRAISKYVASSQQGRHRGPSRKAAIAVNIIPATSP